MALFRSRQSLETSLPRLHGGMTGNRIAGIFGVALLPPLSEAFFIAGSGAFPILALSLVTAFGWQAVFAFWRNRPMSVHAMVSALTFTLLVPADAPLWQLALGLSFGIVVGEQIFGGYGWNFLNPVAVGLTFLLFSFPEAGYGKVGPVGWLVCVPGAILLVATGIVSWRILVGASVTLVAALYLLGSTDAHELMALGGFAFTLLFLGCDPVPAPSTDPGRWIFAFLIGAFVALGLVSGKTETEVFVSAVLLGGIFAPLIDHGVIRFDVWRRGRRYG